MIAILCRIVLPEQQLANYHSVYQYLSYTCIHCLSYAGGSYKNWKKRYFILRESTLQYYKKEGEPAPKGVVDLSTGRGVRSMKQCDLDWPDCARPGQSFGLAVEHRTYYLYGNDQAAIK